MSNRSASLRAAASCALTPLALCLSQIAWAQAAPTPASPETQLAPVSVIGTLDRLQSLDFYAPNSTAVISSKDAETIGSRKLDQALQYQAGIVSEPFGSDNKVDWFKIRGFDASISVDGAPTTPNGFFVGKTEIFGVESIEVLKGANSLVFGAANTGGVVNLITKRPKKERALAVNTEFGNRDKLGLGVDFNDTANADGSVYYRLVGQVRQEDGMQHETEMKSYYFAPSMTIDFSKQTALTLLTSIQREDGTPTNGFMPGYGSLIDTPYGRIDRRTNLGEPDFDHLKRTQGTAGWQLRHDFATDWSFTQNYKYTRVDLNQQNVFAYSSDNNREALRGYSYTQGDMRSQFIDNRVSGRVKLDQVTFTPTFGVDYLESDTVGLNNGFGLAPNLDMFAPVYGAPFAVTASAYEQHLRQLGVYASTQMQVGSAWNFNAGLRHDRAENKVAQGYDVSHNSLNAGVMYVTEFGIAPYLSYSESFRPTVGVDGANNPYVPYEGKQTEVGVKFEPDWLNGGTMTVAYFELEEKNALAADASNVQRQIGKRTNHGFELQGDFKVLRNTAIKASYTHNDSNQDVSLTRNVRTPLIPNNQASVWVNQHVPLSGANSGLTAGLGVRYNGSTVDEVYYPGREVPSYTLLDLMLRYDINRQWAVQFNARNLTDKTYLSGCDFYCYYGGSRTLDLQLQYRM
jgi:iron complex outermembrane receptor protein